MSRNYNRVLCITSGSGGVGLAAIRVALAYEMEVYTTVSNAEKKNFLLEQFPTLKECNIGNSRDSSFERMIKLRTKGKGVDYVLNSLSDDKLHASIRCLGRAGTFLEIGKFDLSNDTKIGLGHFLKEMTFRSVLADNLFLATPAERQRIHELIKQDLNSGVIKPLHSTVFGVNEIEKAYRYLSTGKHVGKVMVQVRQHPYDDLSVPIKALPRVYFEAKKVYIIPGGLGGFGLELADWLILRGARKLILSSSRGISNDYQTYRLSVWKGYGCKVVVSTADITTLTGCEALFKEAYQLGEVDGIFNLAVTLHDNTFDKQTPKSFIDCMSTKAVATHHLNTLTRKYCPKMNYFVVFSSVSCGIGNAGQTNYGMANSVMERIIERRCIDGLSGKAIQWGAIGEVGLVANMTAGQLDIEIAGTVQQRISSCLNVLDILLTTSDPIVESMVVAEKKSGTTRKANVIDNVMNIMSLRDLKSISMRTSLSDLGMDSLMAVEIRQMLEREFEISLTASELRELTFIKLQQLSDEHLKIGAGGGDIVKDEKSHDSLFDVNVFMDIITKGSSNQDYFRYVPSKHNDKEFNTCVTFIPGVEGNTTQFIRAAAEIHRPTFVVSYDAQANTVEDLANALSKDMLEKMKDNKCFYIVGYSYGLLIALECARLLEASGKRVHVVCVDGSPVFLKKLIVNFLKSKGVSEENIQMEIMTILIRLFLPQENLEKIRIKLEPIKTMESKLNEMMDILHALKIDIDAEYAKVLCMGIYNRTIAAYHYRTDDVVKIKSTITLIRTTTDTLISDIDEDYELQRFTEGLLTLKYIDGCSHQSIINSPELTEIINEIIQINE